MAVSDGNIEQPRSSSSDGAKSGVDDRSAPDESHVDESVNMEFVLDIPLEITVELGRTKMLINDMLKLGQGSVIELSKLAGESLEILANQKPIARGEVVVVNEKYGVRLTEVISPMERIERLR
ncbi:MAG: flagellar motor switch protein FliN [Desulfobacterales bacterium]|nr:flagellar motor switch protein FliN [Desulfobacterales bacterium]